MAKSKSSSSRRTPMTPVDAARIKDATVRSNGGAVPKNSFAERAISAAERNVAGKSDTSK